MFHLFFPLLCVGGNKWISPASSPVWLWIADTLAGGTDMQWHKTPCVCVCCVRNRAPHHSCLRGVHYSYHHTGLGVTQRPGWHGYSLSITPSYTDCSSCLTCLWSVTFVRGPNALTQDNEPLLQGLYGGLWNESTALSVSFRCHEWDITLLEASFHRQVVNIFQPLLECDVLSNIYSTSLVSLLLCYKHTSELNPK